MARIVNYPWQFYKHNQLQTFTPPSPSFLDHIRNQANQDPDKEALVGVGTDFKLTYRELVTRMEQTIYYLRGVCGLKPGDSVAVLMENQPELLILNWACWSCGLKTVPLDIKRDTLDRKKYKLELTQARVLFVRNDEADQDELSDFRFQLSGLKVVPLEKPSSFFDLIRERASESYKLKAESLLNSDCLILFTSGTTGLPKGVRLTPVSLWADAAQIIDWLKLTDQDRFHILLPLHHINSTTFSLATILAGGTIVLSPRYSKSGFWPTMAQYRCTLSSIVPTIAYDLLSESQSFELHKDKLNQVTRIQVGSAPVQPTVIAECYKVYGIRFIQGYGSTETSLRCTGVPLDLVESDYINLVQSNSIGTELLYDNVAVLNVNLEKVGEGEEGEICIRGPIVMQGYLDNPEASETVFQGGWFHSEDMGYWQTIHNQKYFFIKGRSKEIIIKGGINISPLVIENVILQTFPNIKVCYAIGFEHPRLGEEIGLVVEGSPAGVRDLEKAIHATAIPGLQSYEQPASLIEVSETELPKTSTGKVQRIEIKRLYSTALRVKAQRVSQTESYQFRVIWPDEPEVIQNMVEIHNQRWPKSLQLTLELAQQQTRSGIVIGMFDQSRLIGTVAGLQVAYQSMIQKELWTQTWDGITSNGSLDKHSVKGDCLVCVGITIQNSKFKVQNSKLNTKKSFGGTLYTKYQIRNTQNQIEVIQSDDKKRITNYIYSGNDPVIGWHMKPKGGYAEGAQILQIIKDGRPQDEESLGYSVLVEYPYLNNEPSITTEASAGTQLLEAALLFAYQQRIKRVVAYSRPAGLKQYLSQNFD